MENEAMSKIVELEKQLMQRNKELESIRVSIKKNTTVCIRTVHWTVL